MVYSAKGLLKAVNNQNVNLLAYKLRRAFSKRAASKPKPRLLAKGLFAEKEGWPLMVFSSTLRILLIPSKTIVKAEAFKNYLLTGFPIKKFFNKTWFSLTRIDYGLGTKFLEKG